MQLCASVWNLFVISLFAVNKPYFVYLYYIVVCLLWDVPYLSPDTHGGCHGVGFRPISGTHQEDISRPNLPPTWLLAYSDAAIHSYTLSNL